MMPRDRLTSLRTRNTNNNALKAALLASCGTLLFVVAIFTAIVRTTTRSSTTTTTNSVSLYDEQLTDTNRNKLKEHGRKRSDLSSTVYLYDSPNEEEIEQREPSSSSDSSVQQNRIAILIPFVSSLDMAQTLPPYFSAFATAAGGSKDLVDFLILHDGIPSSLLPESYTIPSNVRLINIGSTKQMAHLFLRCLDRQKDVSVKIQNSLVKIIGDLLHNYPYLLVEYKPALGHIFQDYIQGYTHWGYSDLDILFGDLPRWITQEELKDFDIVTYGFGDQGRVYLRGQFTFHKNLPDTINQLWRDCKYLSEMHTRFLKAQTGEKSLTLESAEGCYSAAVLKHNNIRIKYAVKAFTDVNSMDYISDKALLGDMRYSHGLYHGIGSDGSKSVIYKSASNMEIGGGQKLVSVPLNWFESDPTYSDPKVPLQREVGNEMTPIQSQYQKEKNGESAISDFNCMYWAPKQYQKHLCTDPKDVLSNDTVFWIDGKLWKQRHETITFFDGTIRTFPFFHFQEWKRTYRNSPLYPVKYPGALGFVFVKEGAIPVYPPVLSAEDDKLVPARAGSTHYHGPGGVVQSHIISNWIQAEDVDRTFLPSSNHVYCLKSSRKQFPEYPEVSKCDEAVSWQDEARVILLNDAPSWNAVHSESDVTLLLTLQLTTTPKGLIIPMLELAERNILSWDNSSSGRRQPCILIIHVAGATEEAVQVIHERFGATSELVVDGRTIRPTKAHNRNESNSKRSLLSHCLIAAIFSADNDRVSQKALMNMAADAAPTRWIVTGLDVERGLIISKESSFFAQRATKVQGDVPGKLFIIPQFSAHSNIHYHDASRSTTHVLPSVGIGELLRAKDSIKLTWDISSLDCIQCEVDKDIKKAEEHLLRNIETLWWEMTLARVTHHNSGRNNGELLEETAWVKTADNIEYELIEFLLPENQDKFETFGITPLMMIDRIGPRKRMLTLNVARGVEEFGGSKCFNGLVLAQLSTLGYDIRVLPGAFAISLPAWRDGEICQMMKESKESTCDGCFMITENIKNDIASEERGRVAKAALLWREMDAHVRKKGI